MSEPTRALASGPVFQERLRSLPSVYHLRHAAMRRLPGFAFDVGDGGAGLDMGIRRNWQALDTVELLPRYGVTSALPLTTVSLFGEQYSAPIGIAPMGSPGIIWPGADRILAQAAQRAGVPFTLSTVSGMSIEEASQFAPDRLWVQMYRFANNDHAIGLDMVARAKAVGAKVLVLTLDVPVRTTRPREMLAGIAAPFRYTPRLIAQALSSPAYIAAFLRNGIPRFANLVKYAPPGLDLNGMARFMQQEFRGAFLWEEVARYRDVWKGPLVVKGVMHPQDVEQALRLGVDGIQVSNHGGRQIEALPATIDVLPAIAAAAAGRAAVLFDSGVRSGLDVVRAMALGADFVFAGKAFLWSMGALGETGPAHAIDLFVDEMRSTLGQIGVRDFNAARSTLYRPA